MECTSMNTTGSTPAVGRSDRPCETAESRRALRTATSATRRLRTGSALLMVMGVLAMLAVIVSTFVQFTLRNTSGSVNRHHTVRMEMLAAGVLDTVRAVMAQDLASDQEPCDHPRFDPWLASTLTDENGLGNGYRYLTRLDLADNAWANGAGAGAGRTPDFANIAAGPTAGVFQDNDLNGIPDTAFYVDADGDGRADSLLQPIGGDTATARPGAVFPDATAAYVGVRIVDNAVLNPKQHSKWTPTPTINTPGFNYFLDLPWDMTDGRVDWTYVPDPEDPLTYSAPNTARRLPRPRLPHVSFENLRNLGMLLSGGFTDDPDGETTFWGGAGGGWTWNIRGDRHTLSDVSHFFYPEGYDVYAAGFAASPTGLVNAGSSPVPPGYAAPGTAATDMLGGKTPKLLPEDDLAIRSFVLDPRLNKYAMLWTRSFGVQNILGATVKFENNLMRCVGSTSRERTKQWMRQPGSANPTYATPFDLRRLLSSQFGDFANAQFGGPNAQLAAKLNELDRWMADYGILTQAGMDPFGNIAGVGGAVRRAQFLANLVEYIRERQPVFGARTVSGRPSAYTINGTTVYGFCPQPVFTEVLRDGGAVPANGLQPGQSRDFSTVRWGIELHNPFDVALNAADYTVEIQAVTNPGGPVTRVQGGTLTIPLSPGANKSIPPYGYVWIGTEALAGIGTAGSEAPPSNSQQIAAWQLTLSGAEATTFKSMGPRVVINLRATASDGTSILLDTVDTRPRAAGGPFTAGRTCNAGYSAAGWRTFAIDWSDWEAQDGNGADNAPSIQDRDNLRAMANDAVTPWTNSGTVAINWFSRRSGIYKGMGPIDGTARPANPLSQVWTGLWHGYNAVNTSDTGFENTGLAGFTDATVSNPWYGAEVNPRRTSPARRNYVHESPTTYNGVVRTAGLPGNITLGFPISLSGRGWRASEGTRFLNLGELANVLTVGNSNANCITQTIAASAELGRTGTYGPNQGVVATGYGRNAPANRWGHINAERRFKFDIYEGCTFNAGVGMPESTTGNVRILDLVTLYMGNGIANNALTEFAPWTGVQADTCEDFVPTNIPNTFAAAKARYREGRINANTAPTFVLRCLPWPRQARFVRTDWNGANTGENVRIADALASSAAADPGYLNRTIAGGRDPYFARSSDIFRWAQGAQQGNANFITNSWGGAGLGWDSRVCAQMPDAGFGFSCADGVTFLSGMKLDPHLNGYKHPQAGFKTNENVFWRGQNPAAPFEFNVHADELGPLGYYGSALRDSLWALSTNVLSSRSDSYTVYIVVKLYRPTPGIPQPLTGGEYEDLGEARLVALIDRTNCTVFSDPASTQYGRIDLRVLPRVLARQFNETN